MGDPSPKPRWKRKRWIAAGLLWLAIAYPLSLGPIFYAIGRQWLPPNSLIESAYAPIFAALQTANEYGQTAVAVVELRDAKGQPVQREFQQKPSWPLAAAATLAEAYWNYVTWCGELGTQHASQP